MEIEVTALVERADDMIAFSSSVFESGEGVGPRTWRNALEEVKERPLIQPKDQDVLRSYIREFGAWDDEEIRAMSDEETNALLLQMIAGDIRQMEEYDSPEEFMAAVEEGRCSGNLYSGEENEEGKLRWYYYIGM